jgi:hypothetical protein
MIYEFRFRDGIKGVVTKHLEAEDLVSADAAARAICNARPGAVFIPNSCEKWLLEPPAAASDTPEMTEAATPKPSNKQQKEALKANGAALKAGTGVGSDVKVESGRIGA